MVGPLFCSSNGQERTEHPRHLTAEVTELITERHVLR
jgi:hypothetical protein